MANIKLIISIPEEIYKASKIIDTKHEDTIQIPLEVIANGAPIPKGYGRIGDLDELIQIMKERNDDNGGEPLNAVDRGYDLAYQHMVKEAEKCVIIEADKEGEDG